MNKIKIGILGLGSRSTIFYINELNKRFNTLYKGYSTFPFILYNTNFEDINPYLPNQFNKIKPLLSVYINNIKRLGVNFLLIPNITLHESIDKIYIDLDIAHPVQLTIDKLIEDQHTKAVIFGSLYTMHSNFLKSSFLQKEIFLLEPKEEHKNFIDYIRKQIYYERETEKDLEEYRQLLIYYSKNHPVIIGCTELSIYSSKNQANLYDMSLLQIEKTLSIFKNRSND